MSRLSVFFFLIFSFYGSVYAQEKSLVNTRTSTKTLEDFMDKRLGLFIHWGPVSLRGTEIGWSRNHGVEQDDYDNLYKEFDPVLFNADAWVKAAKDGGFKYLTITAKHHDGFCLWPTKYTDYNIMNSPYKKDIVGELAKACRKYNIKFCIYYTVLDWYDKRYPVHNDNKAADANIDMGKFTEYMKNQLHELVTNYQPYMLWFDGNWEEPWTYDMGADIYNYLKKLSPELIVNNRLGKGDHKQMGPLTVGDYTTPEQQIGEINMTTPWESCITMCTQWAWKPNDKMKSLKQCISTLAGTAGGNGNLLFNIGPMPDGRIELRQIERMKEMGAWLNKYGAAIYNTRGGPYFPDSVITSTRKGNKINLLLLKSDSNELSLKNIPNQKLVKAYFMNGGSIPFTQNDHKISLTLPSILPDKICPVIVMEMSGNIEQAPVQNRQAD
ncbi:MAG TPA: alpha-L-fucosidase [Chitinophagaceae bacterium]|nr:alpha-L-fucosidase [Chitinophagaceae bacterium]